jgi:uncharacterized protein
MSSAPKEIKQFFSSLKQFAVVGASADPSKFGNKILRCYLAHDKAVIPINKSAAAGSLLIEGLAAKSSIAEIEDAVHTGVSIVTPPAVTKKVIEEGLSLGFRNFFLQPGTADEAVQQLIASEKTKLGNDVHFIQSCVLVQLGCA